MVRCVRANTRKVRHVARCDRLVVGGDRQRRLILRCNQPWLQKARGPCQLPRGSHVRVPELQQHRCYSTHRVHAAVDGLGNDGRHALPCGKSGFTEAGVWRFSVDSNLRLGTRTESAWPSPPWQRRRPARWTRGMIVRFAGQTEVVKVPERSARNSRRSHLPSPST